MKIFLVSKGKTKEPFLSIALEYIKRTQSFASVEYLFFKDNSQFDKKVTELKKLKKARLILLDEKGKQLNTKEFAQYLQARFDDSQNLIFAVSSYDGHSQELKDMSDEMLSLSRLTFPHDFAVAMFAEVLYRSLSLNAGHPYHRE